MFVVMYSKEWWVVCLFKSLVVFDIVVVNGENTEILIKA